MKLIISLSILLLSLCFSGTSQAAADQDIWPEDILYYLLFDLICLLLMLAMITVFKVVISSPKNSN